MREWKEKVKLIFFVIFINNKWFKNSKENKCKFAKYQTFYINKWIILKKPNFLYIKNLNVTEK